MTVAKDFYVIWKVESGSRAPISQSCVNYSNMQHRAFKIFNGMAKLLTVSSSLCFAVDCIREINFNYLSCKQNAGYERLHAV